MFCFVLFEIKVEIVCWGSRSPCSCSFPPLRRTAASVSWVNYFFSLLYNVCTQISKMLIIFGITNICQEDINNLRQSDHQNIIP